VKVLHVLDHSLPLHSGYVFRTQGMLGELRKAGIDTFHVTGDRQDGCGRDEEAVEGYHFFRTRATRLPVGTQLGTIVGLRARLKELVVRLQPDVMHVHSPCLNGLAALSVARKRSVPVIYEMRASWEDAAVSHGSTAEGSVRYRISRTLETAVLRRADHVVTICEGLKSDIFLRGIPKGRITVVPNAVDQAVIREGPVIHEADLPGLEERNRPLIGFFGSFYRYEGLEFLLSALPRIAQIVPDVLLLLLGSGPEAGRLQTLVQQLRLDQHVRFLGRVPHQLIGDYYRAIGVFVYPRQSIRLTELVTPLKPLEALANDSVVVASDIGGHRELISHGETGWLYRPGDAEDLVGKVGQALTNHEHLRPMRERGRQLVLRERRWAAVCPKYVELYQEMVSH